MITGGFNWLLNRFLDRRGLRGGLRSLGIGEAVLDAAMIATMKDVFMIMVIR